MREFIYEMKDMFKGLHLVEGGINTPFLEKALGTRPSMYGLEVVRKPNLKCNIEMEWPFPQVAKIGKETYILYKDTLNRMLYNYSVVPRINGLSEKGYPWTWATIGDYTLFSNFVTLVQLKGDDIDLCNDTTVPVCRALVSYKGQFLAGNIWAYGEHKPSTIAWAQPASIDFERGGDIFVGVGDIMSMKILGNGVMVYGSEGVCRLGERNYPASYGEEVMEGVPGIASQLAVSGNNFRHTFIGTDNNIWRVDLEKGPQKVGCRESLIEGDEFVLSYDGARGELYVGY